MSEVDLLSLLHQINERAAFNRWCGIAISSAGPGKAEISMPWRVEIAQYSGYAHAGIVGALIDTACGYAAATLFGPSLLASHYSVNCLRPAVGERLVARAWVVKAGLLQIFTACELFGMNNGEEKLVATGETILLVVGTDKVR